MGKRPQRRAVRRPSPRQRADEAGLEQQRLNVAAQSLLASSSPALPPTVLQEREWLLAEADRAAQFDPNAANLSRYRFARS